MRVRPPLAAVVLGAMTTIVAGALTAGGAHAATQVVDATTTASATQSWPMYLHDTARSDASTEQILTTASVPYMTPAWTATTGGIIASEPVVVNGVAYFGSWDGYEYAVNTSNGTVLWKTNLGTFQDAVCSPPNMGLTSTAEVYNGVVYVGGGGNVSNSNGTYSQDFYALDAGSGNILWSIPVTTGSSQTDHGYNWSSPMILTDPADGNPYAYIGTASVCDNPLIQGQLLKVSLTTHQIVAAADMVPNGQVGGGIWTSPTYDPATNKIFLSTGTLNLYSQTLSQAVVAVNASTMQVVDHWQLPFEAAVSDSDWGTTPTLTTDSNGDQLLSLANKNGILYTLNRNNLAAGPIWQQQLAYGGDCPTCGDGTISSGAFANNVLYYAAGSVSDAGGVGHGGSVSAFNPQNGQVLWTHYLSAPPLGSIIYDNGMLFYGNGQYEEALNASNGQSIWDYNLGAGTYAAPSISGGMLFQGALNGDMFAFAPPASLPPPPPADPNCPTGFTCQDIGTTSGRIAGSESVSNGTVSVTASGNWRENGDNGRIITEPETGNFQATVEDLSETAGPASAGYKQPQMGIVVRQSFQTGTPFYVALQDPTYPNEKETVANVIIYYRDTWGGPIVELTQNYPMAFPRYLMVQRNFDTFQTLFSSDDKHWTLISATVHTIPMPTTLQVGMDVSSYADNTTSTGQYTGFTVSPTLTTSYLEQNEPNPCPTSWKCYDVGAGSPIGTETLANGVWTVSGGGEGVELVADGELTHQTYDQFHYIYQTMSGDGTLTARLVSLANGSATAQAVMVMRADLTEGSPFYGVVVKPNGTATLEWRLHNAIQQRDTISLGTLSFPTWFQLNRYTDKTQTPSVTYYSLLTSPDGQNWSQVNGSTVAINMGSNPLEGFGGSQATPKASNQSSWDNVTVSSTSTQPPGVCPVSQGYTCTDVGVGSAEPGGQEYANGTWTFNANGADIWDVYDFFHFVYQTMTEDGTVSAQVVSVGTANYDDEWEKAGVMMRASTDPQAVYYGVFITPQHGIVVQWRSTYQGTTNQVIDASGPSYPVYLMVTRWTDPHAGGLTYFTAYYSTDNKTFTPIPNTTVALPLTGTIDSGMAADSYNEKTTLPVTFDNFALFNGTENPPPGACPSSVAGCADFGGATPAGTQTLSGSTLTVTAGGGDIWNTTDQFHYVWQTLAGDGGVSADVSSQTDTGNWAKAGVMMRSESGSGGLLDPSAPYYAVFVTPANGVDVQWRSAEGASTSQMLTSGTVPTYLQVTRYTDGSGNQNFSAFTSTDGVNWTWLPGSTQVLPLTGTILAGWAADSNSQTTSSTVTFSNISVSTSEPSPTGVCPSGWTCNDVGGATPSGAQNAASGSSWSVYGGGGDIWSTSDQFRYISQPMSTDGTVTAEVTSQQNTNGWAKAGVMMRASATDAGSPYYALFVTPSNGVVVQWRTSEGANTNQIAVSGTVPVYLRIERWTDTSGASPVTYFAAFTSSDGVNWTWVANSSVTVSGMPSPYTAGIAVTSHNTSVLSGVGFTGIAVGTTSTEPPGVCLAAYTCADIGGATPAGSESTSAGTWTVQAGGGDIWNTSDQFRYIWTTTTSSSSVSSVEVSSLQNTNVWAKAGVMLRLSSDPAAPYYAIFITPGNGLDVQWRTTEGGSTSQVTVASLAAPIYLQITRSGTTFTAAYSTNGSTWTTVSGSAQTIAALTGTLLDGLATTSHTQSQLTTAVYQNLNI